MTITTFRKVYVDNLISWDHDRTVKGYVYLTSDQDFPKANDYIENHLYILHDENSDKPFHLFLDRSDYQSDHLIDLETMLFDWANGEYHDGTYRIVEASNTDYIKTNFGLYNDENDPIYEGFYKPSDGRWNGWLQPYTDKSTFQKIVKDVFPESFIDEDDQEYWEDFKNQQPNKDGLYDVAWGICWMSEEDC